MIEIRELVIEATIEDSAKGVSDAQRDMDERLTASVRELRRELHEELRDALRAQKEETPWRFSNVR